MKLLKRRKFMGVLLAVPAALVGVLGLGKFLNKIGVDLAKPNSDLTVKYTAWVVDKNGKIYPVSLDECQFYDAIEDVGPNKQVTINIDRPMLTHNFGE